MGKLRLYEKIEMIIANHIWLYYILNYTWGILGTIIGYITLLFLIIFGKINLKANNYYNGKKYFITKKYHPYSFSIGTTVVCGCLYYDKEYKVYDCYSNNSMITHEIGHSIQNALFGPLTIFIIYIPSVIRYWYRYFNSNKNKTAYEDIWFERNASEIGWEFLRKKYWLL